jgi:hypothetical protein
MFEIGVKVRWWVGKQSNPILIRGLYKERLSDTTSLVLVLEQNGLPRKADIEVQTNLLEEDYGD